MVADPQGLESGLARPGSACSISCCGRVLLARQEVAEGRHPRGVPRSRPANRGIPSSRLPPLGRGSGGGSVPEKRAWASAARAALAPRAPCTPPPGCAEAEAEVEPADRRLGAAPARHRPEHQLLVELGGAAVDRAADQVRVAGLAARAGRAPAGPGSRDAKPGSEPLDPGLHPVGEALAVVAVPGAADEPSPASRAHALRHVGVGPQRLGAGGRPASGRPWSSGRRAGTGRPGSAPAATWPSASLISSTESATWTVPARAPAR